MTILYLDQVRRLKLYDEGGVRQERRLDGLVEWINADHENWDDELRQMARLWKRAIEKLGLQEPC